MITCRLCESSETSNFYHSMNQDIVENYKISDAVEEHFQYSELILTESPSNFICASCFKILKSFKELQMTVCEVYSKLKAQNSQFDDLQDMIEIEIEESTENDEFINEEYLEEEPKERTNPSDILIVKSQSRRKHPANDIEGEQKIRDLVDIKCYVCDINFETYLALCKHFKDCHPGEKAFLMCCDKKFTQRSILLEHLEYHDRSRVHRCDICAKEFKTNAIYKSHVRNFHNNEKNKQSKCSLCGKMFTNKYILKTHMRKHIEDENRTFECYICKKSVKNFELLRDHFKNKHSNQKSQICHICSKIVTRLDIHLKQVHSTEPIERIKCEICGHWLKKTSLKGHMAGHNESGFSCDICGKYLKNKNTYFCHMKRVHTEGKFKCENCEKSFHSEGRLKDHVACQHTGNYLYKCRISSCEKMFRNSGRRRIHEKRMHPIEYDRNLKPMYLREQIECQ